MDYPLYTVTAYDATGDNSISATVSVYQNGLLDGPSLIQAWADWLTAQPGVAEVRAQLAAVESTQVYPAPDGA